MFIYLQSYKCVLNALVRERDALGGEQRGSGGAAGLGPERPTPRHAAAAGSGARQSAAQLQQAF